VHNQFRSNLYGSDIAKYWTSYFVRLVLDHHFQFFLYQKQGKTEIDLQDVRCTVVLYNNGIIDNKFLWFVQPPPPPTLFVMVILCPKDIDYANIYDILIQNVLLVRGHNCLIFMLVHLVLRSCIFMYCKKFLKAQQIRGQPTCYVG
jgi:hypothetical protein